MATYRLTLAYDGTDYAGWQVQTGAKTVQGTLETALALIIGSGVRVTASGRTDAGVHALGQVASFEAECRLAPAALLAALNANLPPDVAVLAAEEAPAGFHARRDARRKRYRYQLDDSRLRDVFARRYAWQVWQRLHEDAMRRAAQALVGRHDFASFQTSGSPRRSTVRTIFELAVARAESPADNRILIEIEADGFLYNMVRAIVGTLVEVGRGVQGEPWPAEVLAARDRRAAGRTAPAQGLFLVCARYD